MPSDDDYYAMFLSLTQHTAELVQQQSDAAYRPHLIALLRHINACDILAFDGVDQAALLHLLEQARVGGGSPAPVYNFYTVNLAQDLQMLLIQAHHAVFCNAVKPFTAAYPYSGSVAATLPTAAAAAVKDIVCTLYGNGPHISALPLKKMYDTLDLITSPRYSMKAVITHTGTQAIKDYPDWCDATLAKCRSAFTVLQAAEAAASPRPNRVKTALQHDGGATLTL